VTFAFWRGNLIGVDIGSYSIKVIKFKGRRGNYELDAATYTKMPSPMEGDEGLLGKILADIMKSQGIKGSGLASAIASKYVTIRRLTLPVMPKKDLKKAVIWEMRKGADLAIGDIVCDFIIMGEIDQPEGRFYSIIAFGVAKDDVGGLIRLFKGTSREVVAVDVVPMALLASFDLNNTWEEATNYAIIDIGKSSSTLAIFKDQKIRFAREIMVGGGDITKAVADGMSSGEEGAEEEKIRCGLSKKADNPKVRGFIIPVIDRLINEISLSSDYYSAQFREGILDRIYLSGGSSMLKGLDEYISSTLNIPCFVDDPLRGVKIPKRLNAGSIKQYTPALSVAVGLATRRA
jgi:type IV pilus assembly protein PilM